MKKKREKLEELHRKMLTEIQDFAIILLDRDGTVLSWNAGVQKINGYKENEVIGEHFRIFYLPDDRKSGLPEKLLNQAIKGCRVRHVGKRMRKDGTTFWGSIHITALHDESGEVIGFTKLTKELTDVEIL
ncbi:MAG: PAS domain-containing protein [Bacteroidia bacterium]